MLNLNLTIPHMLLSPTKKHPKERLGEWLMLGQVFLDAFWPIGALYGALLIPQLQFLAYLTLLSGILFFLTTLFGKGFKIFKNIKVLWLMLAYTLLVGVIPYAIIIYYTPSGTATEMTILTQSEAVYAAFFGWFVLRENLDFYKICGILSILLANIIILKGTDISWSLPSIALTLAPMIFVFGNIISKKLIKMGVSWSPLLLFRSVIGGLILLGIAAYFEDLALPSRNLWPFLLAFSFGIFGFAKILWQKSLEYLDLSKATALGMCRPIFSIFLAFVLLKEVPSTNNAISIIFTVLAMVFLFKSHSEVSKETSAKVF